MADLNIIAINPSTRRVSFSFNTLPSQARGMETLLQLCVKTVLTTPGIDVFTPEYGGGMLSFLRMGLTTADIPSISADITYVVGKATEQIIKEQEMSTEDIPLSEKLKSMTIMSIQWDEADQSLDARILVTSMLGEQADISLANQLRFSRTERGLIS